MGARMIYIYSESQLPASQSPDPGDALARQHTRVAWNSMMLMREIRPRGIFASVQRLQMFHVTTPHLFIFTNDISLGSVFSPTLIGPTPAVLAQGMGAPPAP